VAGTCAVKVFQYAWWCWKAGVGGRCAGGRRGRLVAVRLRLGLARRVGVDVVREVQHVARHRRRQLVTARRNQRKPKELEGSDQRRSIFTVLLEADDDLAAAKDVLRMLQHRHKALSRPLGEDVPGDLDEERLADEERVPLDVLLVTERHREAEVRHAVASSAGALLRRRTSTATILLTFDTDRGLFDDPHTAALCPEASR